MNGDILVPVVFTVSVFGIIYLYITSKHRERLSMIEKGIEPSMFESKEKTIAQTLKMGMLLIGISLGILAGHLLTTSYIKGDNPVFYFSMIFLFGGLSLIINYFIERRKNNSDEK
jgi:hypothetical protein